MGRAGWHDLTRRATANQRGRRVERNRGRRHRSARLVPFALSSSRELTAAGRAPEPLEFVRCRRLAEPSVLRLRMADLVLAVDIGGTKMAAGLVALDGTLVNGRCSRPAA